MQKNVTKRYNSLFTKKDDLLKDERLKDKDSQLSCKAVNNIIETPKKIINNYGFKGI